MPASGEWYRAADDLAYAAYEAQQAKPALAQHVHDDEEMAALRTARDGFLAQLRVLAPRAADRLAALPLRHPDDYPGPRVACRRCDDTGWAAVAGEARMVERCPCHRTNPQILRRIATRQRTMPRGRRA